MKGRIDPSPSDIERALTLENFDVSGAWSRLAPAGRFVDRGESSGRGRPAAVAIIVYPEKERLRLILIRRSSRLNNHAGQIAFPGGALDPEDHDAPAAALRETCEEIGLCDLERYRFLGRLSDLHVSVSGFLVHPCVFFYTGSLHFRPEPEEVDEILTISLYDLFSPAALGTTMRNTGNRSMPVPCYRRGDLEIWGATAVILSELEERLRAVL